MQRSDLRAYSHMRPPRREVQVVSSAEGSCKFYQGNTCVVVTVHGPESKASRHERHDRAELLVNYNLGQDRSVDEKAAAIFVYDSLASSIELKEYARKLITLNITVICDDGSTLSCAINAATLALLHSGISMKRVPLSVTVFSTQDGSDIVGIDPVQEEESNQKFSTLVAVFSNVDIGTEEPSILVSRFSESSVNHQTQSAEDVDKMFELAIEGSRAMYSFFKKSAEIEMGI